MIVDPYCHGERVVPWKQEWAIKSGFTRCIHSDCKIEKHNVAFSMNFMDYGIKYEERQFIIMQEITRQRGTAKKEKKR